MLQLLYIYIVALLYSLSLFSSQSFVDLSMELTKKERKKSNKVGEGCGDGIGYECFFLCLLVLADRLDTVAFAALFYFKWQ